MIGIVPATRDRVFEQRTGGAVYLPFARGFQSNVFFFVKMKSLPSDGEVADLLRRTVNSAAPSLPVLSIKTFSQHLDGASNSGSSAPRQPCVPFLADSLSAFPRLGFTA